MPTLAEWRKNRVRRAIGLHDLARCLDDVVGEGVKSHTVFIEVGLDLGISRLGVGLVILIGVDRPDLSRRGKCCQHLNGVVMGDDQGATALDGFLLELNDAVVQKSDARVCRIVKTIQDVLVKHKQRHHRQA